MTEGLRVKGQETDLRISKDGELVGSFGAVRSFEVEFMLKVIAEGYIGEVANRYDDVYDGIRIKLEVHSEDGGILDFVDTLVQRAQRNPAFINTRIGATSILNYPDGSRRLIMIPDIRWGNVPQNTPGRDQYVAYTLDGNASKYKLQKL